MNSKGNTRIFIYLIVALLSSRVSGQQSLLLKTATGENIEDAVVNYFPVGQAAAQRVDVSDENGLVLLDNANVYALQISKTGYTPVIDTLPKNTKRTYVLLTNTMNIKEYVVTGQFEATAANNSVQPIKVIDRKRIEQQGAVSLKDVLSNELNITISQDATLGSQIRMMGMGGQNVKILIDGVPVIGRVDGNIDVSQINMNNVERIEIVEGPMSVIYGTDALGGVINIITRKPRKKEYSASANAYYETVGTYNFDAAVGMKYKKYSVNLSGGRNFFDGYSPIENKENRWRQWKPKTQIFSELQQSLKLGNLSLRLQSNIFNEVITSRNNPVITPQSVTGLDDYFVTFRTGTSLYTDYYCNNKATLNFINAFTYYRRIKYTQVKNLVTGTESPTTNPDDRDTSIFNLILARATYTTHHKHKWNSQFGYDINIETGEGKRLKDNKQHISDFAAFYVGEYKPTGRLVLKPGLRVSYNTRFGTPLVPSMSAKYDINSKLTYRASYSRGFRAPSLKELSMYFVDVNHNIQGRSDLKAEVSDNLSTSLAYVNAAKKFTFKTEVTAFYNTIRNMIGLAVVDPTQNLYTYLNIDKFKTVGTNVNASIQTNRITLNVGYGNIGRYNQLNSYYANVPEFSFNAEVKGNLSYSFIRYKTDIALFYKYTGRAPGYSVDNNNAVFLTKVAAYEMMDASLTKQLMKGKMSFTIGVKNIFDVNAVSFNSGGSTTHGGGGGVMNIGMGRYMFSSIRINIGKN